MWFCLYVAKGVNQLIKKYVNYEIVQMYRTLVNQSSFLNSKNIKSVWGVHLPVKKNLDKISQVVSAIEDVENLIKTKYSADEFSEEYDGGRKIKKQYEKQYLDDITEINVQESEIDFTPIKESDLSKFMELNEGIITSAEANILYEMMEV